MGQWDKRNGSVGQWDKRSGTVGQTFLDSGTVGHYVSSTTVWNNTWIVGAWLLLSGSVSVLNGGLHIKWGSGAYCTDIRWDLSSCLLHSPNSDNSTNAYHLYIWFRLRWRVFLTDRTGSDWVTNIILIDIFECAWLYYQVRFAITHTREWHNPAGPPHSVS